MEGRREEMEDGKLVCGGSPVACVLVERKAQHRGKWKQQQHRTSLHQVLVQHKCTVEGKMNGKYLQLPFPLCRAFHSTRTTRLGEPPPVASWSRGDLVIEVGWNLPGAPVSILDIGLGRELVGGGVLQTNRNVLESSSFETFLRENN